MRAPKSIVVLSVALLALISYQYLEAQSGTPPQPVPSGPPPGDNIDPPVVTSGDDQVKDGGLTVGANPASGETGNLYSWGDFLVEGGGSLGIYDQGDFIVEFESDGAKSGYHIRPNMSGREINFFYNTNGAGAVGSKEILAPGYAFRESFATDQGKYQLFMSENKASAANEPLGSWNPVLTATPSETTFCIPATNECIDITTLINLVKLQLPDDCAEGSVLTMGVDSWQCGSPVPDMSNCTTLGGTIVEENGRSVCDFGGSCPAGWTQFTYTTSVANTCSGGSCGSGCTAPAWGSCVYTDARDTSDGCDDWTSKMCHSIQSEVTSPFCVPL